jgi:regulatory protein
MRDEGRQEALKRSLNFLGYRARNKKEIRAKLSQLGFPEKTTEVTLQRLRSLHGLNDKTFAWGWASGKTLLHSYGPLRIERELRKKGITKSTIALILRETFTEDGEKERARILLEKKSGGSDLRDTRVSRRAGDFLQRRGYRRSVVPELLRTFSREKI